MTARKPMSEILKSMAITMLAVPDATSSTEAAAAALLLSHVAWQQANGHPFPDAPYEHVLAKMERARPELWREMTFDDPRTIIARLVACKKRHHPHDKRNVVACGIFGGKVRVEWVD